MNRRQAACIRAEHLVSATYVPERHFSIEPGHDSADCLRLGLKVCINLVTFVGVGDGAAMDMP